MSEVWAVIVAIIIFLVIYGYISSKLSERRKARARKEAMPEIAESIRAGRQYNVHLSDGRSFLNVTILGSVEPSDDQYSFTNWEGVLVLQRENGKRVFIKQPSIRFVEEA